MKVYLPLAIFACLAGLFLYVLDQMRSGEYNPRSIPTEFIGRTAPTIDLPNLLDPNDRVESDDYLGKTWLVNVWGSWCPACWQEHAYLMALSRKGVPIVGINWRDDEANAKKMLVQEGNPFAEIGVDPQSNAVIDWGVYGAPETFLIDADGVVRAKHAGPLDQSIWDQKFQPYFTEVEEAS